MEISGRIGYSRYHKGPRRKAVSNRHPAARDHNSICNLSQNTPYFRVYGTAATAGEGCRVCKGP